MKEIEDWIKAKLVADTTPTGYLGGSDRVVLSWEESDELNLTTADPGFIVIEMLRNDAPVGENQLALSE